ncbi:MAG: LutB/LldF family L-lactate oxidation iron-sulfur protein, partial [Acidobacteriota bacterium]
MIAPTPRIQFREYSKNVPPNIPIAIQSATRRLLASRAIAVGQISNWEDLRQAAHDARMRTLLHLDDYLAQLQSSITACGGSLHLAYDAAEANSIIVEIARKHGVQTAVKGKSMASEEIGLNHALERAGVRAVETDIGEFVIQMAGIGPSHILGPAMHMTKEEIAGLFSRQFGVDAPPQPRDLTDIARAHLRQDFLRAEMGITGANFVVAETGTIALVTNEGNGRMCSTLPDLYVVVAGIDKVIPDLDTLALMLRLLARNATGQSLSCYTSLMTGPRRDGEHDGPREFHLVLIDNSRRRILQDPLLRETLLCIRCAACLNVCPVYNHVGGHAYGWVYSGPIGAILSTQLLGTRVARELPFASSLCGACTDICPVKIPITKILLELRHRVAEGDANQAPSVTGAIRFASNLSARTLEIPWIYRLGSRLLKIAQTPFRRGNWLRALPPPLNRWTEVRPLPVFAADFREWWKAAKGSIQKPNSRISEPYQRPSLATHSSPFTSQQSPTADSRSPVVNNELNMDHFLAQVNKLSGHGDYIDEERLDKALRQLVETESVKKATLWATGDLTQLQIASRLGGLGVVIIPHYATKNELAQADLGVTEADFILPDSGS